MLAVLTVPISSNISLCTFEGYKFGVFGLCDDSDCTRPRIGYKPEQTTLSGFSLPSNARHSISFLLVVHPISAAFTAVQIILTYLLFYNMFSSQSKFLLLVLFWTLPTFLLGLLSFLVDILLFIPHLNWCGWALLVPVVFIAFCGTTLCIMRRTVTSRIAYKTIQDRKTNGFYLSSYANNYYDDEEDVDDDSSSSLFDDETTHISSYLDSSYPSSRMFASESNSIEPPQSSATPAGDDIQLQNLAHQRHIDRPPVSIFSDEP
ncbi:unnamed protein product [Ambrosiozyma monospora]|uniref:Unnamed protein product n=1 Tax=Ambrosiozyma monospora TaxID=43982 RepID=A0A9W7DMQ5_AMBMO|nr:unnamed protein product [Ambrosiozyma monospora]